MKKTYMQPSMEVVNVTAESLICESLTLGATEYNGTSAVEARDRYDFDDDDDLGSIIPW